MIIVILVMAFVAIFISLVVHLVRKELKTKTYINIENKVSKAYQHKGCETEGFAIHPEKTGELKKDKNPFEL